MLIIKKAWAFLSTHWYVPVLLLVVVVMRGKSDSLKGMLESTKESYKKQIQDLEDINEDQRNKEKKIRKEQEEVLGKIEEEFIKNNEKLNQLKKKRIKNLVKKFYNDPDELSSQISKKFGLTFTKTSRSAD